MWRAESVRNSFLAECTDSATATMAIVLVFWTLAAHVAIVESCKIAGRKEGLLAECTRIVDAMGL